LTDRPDIIVLPELEGLKERDDRMELKFMSQTSGALACSGKFKKAPQLTDFPGRYVSAVTCSPSAVDAWHTHPKNYEGLRPHAPT